MFPLMGYEFLLLLLFNLRACACTMTAIYFRFVDFQLSNNLYISLLISWWYITRQIYKIYWTDTAEFRNQIAKKIGTHKQFYNKINPTLSGKRL
jgi:hypothetical protein